MKPTLHRPSPEEDAEIALGIRADPDAAPDLSHAAAGIARRPGRPLKKNPEAVDRFKSTGPDPLKPSRG